MGDETSHRHYNKPEKGETDWHEPVNENWDDIDTDIHDLYTRIGTNGSQGHPDKIYVETAAEIQPAIDDLAANRGGVVQLGAKTYYPETTLWLKSGVTLKGVRRTRQVNRIHRDPNVEPFPNPKQSTVISTRDMNEGADAWTHEHDVEDPHPHFPLIAAYVLQTVENGQPVDRDPTDEELANWGADISLQNVILDASESNRWWEYDRHGPGTVYDGSVDNGTATAAETATYFGVYDATIFERTADVFTKNVETRGFLGYGGFWKDARNSLDIGGLWRGGATDYHGNAYTLDTDHDRGSATYTTGIWDFSAEGPTPTVWFGGHGANKVSSVQSVPSNTASGSPAGNTITGTQHRFLGDERAFWAGEAPLVDPEWADVVVAEPDQRTTLDSYSIRSSGNSRRGIGFRSRSSNTSVRNVDVSGFEIGLDSAGNRSAFQNIQLADCDTAVRCHNILPEIDGARIRECISGFAFSRADPGAAINGVNLQFVDVFIQSGHNKSTTFNYPYFYEVDSFGRDFDGLVLNAPGGHESVAGFPDRHKPGESIQ